MGKRNLYSQIWFPFLLELLSIAVFVLTAWIAQTTLELTPKTSFLGFTIDSSTIITLLSITNGLQAVLISTILFSLFEAINWTLIGRGNGCSSVGVLGLSPTTGFLGSVRIVFSRCLSSQLSYDSLESSSLVSVLCALDDRSRTNAAPVADTSIGITHTPVFSYPVTAGNGQFNGSTVRPYIELLQGRDQGYEYTIVPYWMQAVVNNLVTTPMHSAAGEPVPVAACAELHCNSYLLPGGVVGATPWPPTNYSSAPVIEIIDAPTFQIDFAPELNGHSFSEDECSLYGANDTYVGIRFCLAESRAYNGSFAAGIFVCPEGVSDGICSLGNNSFQPNLTSTFSVFSPKATFVVSRSNMSILSVASLDAPIQQPVLDIDSFRVALSWILDFNASRIPAATSIADQFWSSQEQLKSVYWSPVITQTFHSLIAFPFWFFNANSLGNTENQSREISPSLPPEFYTTASLATQHYKIVISNAMFATFVALHCTLHLFIWIMFLWLCIKRPSLPAITSFPLFDFAFKTTYTRNTVERKQADGRVYQLASQSLPLAGVLSITDGEALSALKPCKHFLGHGDFSLPGERDSERLGGSTLTSSSSILASPGA
ncbi:hypothetical protein BJY04DRAFT_222803 [Aspergillus karnatakaensis]|uniref:uncharacterized protein n=1 Tax=Aspergillus karnatakaensis TaxID=1810916 RepID=UPI003CCCC411